MADTRSLFETIAGVGAGSSLSAVLEKRTEIMALSQASHDAVLMPVDPGGLPHAARAAIAARMAALNGDAALASHYRGLMDGTTDTALADPSDKAHHDQRMAAILRHVDLVTLSPRDATRSDIEVLKQAGVTEADIVRLSELVAFVNYQARVVATLRLLGGAS